MILGLVTKQQGYMEDILEAITESLSKEELEETEKHAEKLFYEIKPIIDNHQAKDVAILAIQLCYNAHVHLFPNRHKDLENGTKNNT